MPTSASSLFREGKGEEEEEEEEDEEEEGRKGG